VENNWIYLFNAEFWCNDLFAGLADFITANVEFNVAAELVVQYDWREFNCGEHASGSK